MISRTVTELPGCDVYSSINETLSHCCDEEDIYVIGGESIYRQTMPLADRLCLTEIDDETDEADAFFPEYKDEWHETTREEHGTDERHAFRYAFVDYERI